MSRWAYGCKLQLAQDWCGKYEPDKNAPGYRAGFGGCPSCKHRDPNDSYDDEEEDN